MKKLLVILFVILSFPIIAQETKLYLNKYSMVATGSEEAVYYRKVERKGALYLVRDYYVSNDQLQMEGTYAEIDPRLKEGEGTCQYFYEDGKLKQVGDYKGGEKAGLWKTYYDNEALEEEILYQGKKALYLQHWDRNGNPYLVNGTGIYSEESPTSGSYSIEILDSILIASYSINEVSGDTIYLIVQETAQYKGGMPALYSSLGRELKYPKDARRADIEGKVFIEFVVDKNGKVREMQKS